MHPCLYIPEILTKIFGQDSMGTNVLRRRDICALVTTCKTFSGPAIAILWRELWNLVPLLLAMPIDLWELKTSNKSSWSDKSLVTFKRDVVPEDWRMFDFYAQFVKELGAFCTAKSSINSVAIDRRIWQELGRRDCLLLPNLEMLLTSGIYHHFPLLLGPSTQSLGFYLCPDDFTDPYYLVEDIYRRSPHLKSLYLRQDSEWSSIRLFMLIDFLPELLRNLPDLEIFSCNWLPQSIEGTTALLEAPNLREMTIYQGIAALEQILLKDKKKNELRLREVSIKTDRLGVRSLAGLLISLRPALLTSFQVSVGDWCFQADLDSFFHAIAKHCSHTRFTKLVLESTTIRMPTTCTPPVDFAPANFSTLRPLLPFSRLRVLILEHHPFDITDAEIKELAMAWPNLKEWKYAVTTILEPRTTMRGLLWLATFCRKLEVLTFSFNGMYEVLPDELALAANHGLTTLDVGDSMIEKPEEMANFLDAVFPKLRYIQQNSMNDRTTRMWYRVKKFRMGKRDKCLSGIELEIHKLMYDMYSTF